MLFKNNVSAIKYFVLALSALLLSCNNDHSSNKVMEKLVNQELDFAVKQYTYFKENIPDDKLPKTFDVKNDSLVVADARWWTNGFYPGTLWYLYDYSGNESLKSEAEGKLKLIEPLKNYKGSHDLGFLLFNSFGNAYKITGNEAYKEVVMQASASLVSRYNDTVKSIKSWDWTGDPFPVIIDNMLNLEMLTWAAEHGGDKKWKEIAINHANTTLKNHFREDESTWHVVYYLPEDGKVDKKKTHQGYSDSSTWARGQAWALYGYTMMYRETKNPEFLEQAKKVADYLFDHPRMPEDSVPYWDFDDPTIPDTYRDVSAAAAIASGLLDLAVATEKDKEIAKDYRQKAETILKSLSQEPYRYDYKEGVGFLLKRSVGSLPGDSEVDVPLTYADYYYVEALLRYKKWFLD